MDDRVVLSSLIAPVSGAVAISAAQVDLTWHRVAGAAAYAVDGLNGGLVQTASLSSHANSRMVNGLVPDTTCNLRVGVSGAAQTVTIAAPAPAAPSCLIYPVSTTQIGVSWAPASGATSYHVFACYNNTWHYVAGLNGSTTGYVVSGLPANSFNFILVAAMNAQGQTSWGQCQMASTYLPWWAFDHHPDSLGSYAPAYGPLFKPGGPSYLDVQQGDMGDCWLLASLAEAAAIKPADITNMFTYVCTTVENGHVVDVYNVRFFDSSGIARYVTVDTELPKSSGGYYYENASDALWPALAEKAYIEANKLGYVTTQHVGYDSYLVLDFGQAAWALQAITGNDAYTDSPVSAYWLAKDMSDGLLVVIGSNTSPSSQYIVGSHAYAVVGYDSSSGLFHVYNPWGTNSSGWVPGQAVWGLFWQTGSFLAQNFATESYCVGMGVMQVSTNDHDVLLGVIPIDFVGRHLGNKPMRSADHTQAGGLGQQLFWDVSLA
jgi:hypothetical protein